MKIDFKIITHGSKEWETAVKLREDILRKPLGDSFTPEELEEEKNHIQIAVFNANKIIGTAVLVPEGSSLKMQRVVVNDDLRNQNIGSKMMTFCENYAHSKGYQTMYCHARNSAVNFYSKNNYNAQGDYFDEDGIPHLKMYKNFL